MRALIRGYLDEVYVEFNGDVNDKPGQREKELGKTQGEIAALKKSFRQANKNGTEVNSEDVVNFNKFRRKEHELENDFDNMLIVTLVHPGEDGDVKLLKALPLGNGKQYGYKPNSQKFLSAGIFKKIAVGEFGIRVAVTDKDKDKDKANPLAKFLRRVVAGTFNSIVKTPMGEISNVIVSNTAQQLWSDVEGALKGEGEGDKISVSVVAVSKTAKFKIEESGGLTCTNDEESCDIAYSEATGVLTLNLTFPEMIETGTVRSGGQKFSKYSMPDSPNGKAMIRLESVKL